MRRILAIVDENGEYAVRLAAYFNEQSSIGFRASAFTDLESFKSFRNSAKIEILLLSEAAAAKAQGLTDGSKVILLSEDGFIPGADKRPFGAAAVFKYRPADTLAREIMNIYSEAAGEIMARAGSGGCEIYGIYSPVNRCGKTTMALTLGLVHARRGRTLLISLEEYAGVFLNIQPDSDSDLSDIIYCFLQGSYSWSRLKGAVHSFGQLDYIPPVRCMEDVSQISSEEIARLIRRIAEESGYASILIDFGSFGRRASELLEVCGRIFMPVPADDPAARLKLEAFQEYLERSGKTEIKDHLVKCELPWEQEKAQDYARALLPVYESGALYDYCEKLH